MQFSYRSPGPIGRLLLRCGILSIAVMTVGCGDAPVPPPERDEARKRADVENESVESAAERYFFYRQQMDGYASDSEMRPSPEAVYANGRIVHDYFPGMDAISLPQSSIVTSENETPTEEGGGAAEEGGASEEVTGYVNAPPADSAAPASVAPYPDALLDKQSERPATEVVSPDLNVSERIGRNTWMVWCGGNEGFWDWLATDSLGFIDLLKVVDTRNRRMRFRDSGMINEPGMRQARAPAPGEFGLWLDLPEDDRIRAWRRAYVTQSFDLIKDGRHKSQVGLKKGPDYDEMAQTPLYRGEPTAFKEEGYLYPSDYLPPDESPNQGIPSYAAAQSDSEGAAYDEENLYDATIPPPDMYGLSSGVIGLRLFPNPYFDEEAQKKWDPESYYNDRDYFTDPELVRPYRVGMACSFCHTSFHPLQPPVDIENPDWHNLSGSIGAQYLSMRATVGNLLTPDQFVYHLLESQPRGTIDTSLIASDNINNPNTFNAIFGLKQRAILSLHNPKERLSADSATLPSLWINPDPRLPLEAPDRVPQELVDELLSLYPEDRHDDLVDRLARSNDQVRHVPRILLDGSDSIGTWGALARVYLNIGSYWEQWNAVHQVVVGFEPQRPFKLSDCEQYSVYWNATEQRVPGLRDYFLKVTPPMPLLSTDGAEERLEPINEEALKRKAELESRPLLELLSEARAQHVDTNQLARGRQVFAEQCIVCHSSIQPETAYLLMNQTQDDSFQDLIDLRNQVRFASESNGEYFEHDPAQWLGNPDYQRWACAVVEEPEFWTNNYLSTDYRVAVNVVGTNSARAMGTNGMTDHMWQDFASESYRQLPSPGMIPFFNPYKGDSGDWDKFSPRHKTPEGAPPQGGGPGYYRVPTLISVWATAPLLHNNSLGLYNNDPSVEGRLEAFDDAIRKMLWPEKRLESSSYNGATAERLRRDHGLIWRTPQKSYLSLDGQKVPAFARRLPLISSLHERFPWLKNVTPIWFPPLILMVIAWVVLWVSNDRRRRLIGILLLVTAAALALVVWLARTFPQWSWLDIVRGIYPIYLPLGVLAVAGLVLLLPLSRTWARRFGYLSIVASLLIGAVLYFNAGRLGDIRIGPIPAGTPVNLLANFNPEAPREQQVKSVAKVVAGLAEIESRDLSEDDAAAVMRTKIAPALMEVNKCPDFVMDRGHYFPWFDAMTDDDKNALIELLKTL